VIGNPIMVNGKLRICVIFGGRSGEHEVSLMSARSILGALDPEKYDVTQIGITHSGRWLVGDQVLDAFQAGITDLLTPVTLFPDPTLKGIFVSRDSDQGMLLEHLRTFDVFFPALHGTFGEDGTLQGLFEMAGVAYVGAGVLGSSLGMDKGVFKDVMRANDIPVVEAEVVLRSEITESSDNLIARLESIAPYPLFTKPANLGSSVGVTKCRSRSDLYEGLLEAARFDRRILVERGVNAREIEISVLGNDDPIASVPGEICPAADFYSYEAKYHDDRSELFIPANIPHDVAEQMKATAVKAYKAIDCAGMARVDFMIDKDSGKFYLNELNTIPGFTRISMYPKLWEASGLPYPVLIDRLVELALERRSDRDQTERRYER
jgi:D-alanine-D-alanine ligase